MIFETIEQVRRRSPTKMENFFAKLSYLPPLKPGDTWVAGGAVRSIFDDTQIDDVDFFFANAMAFNNFKLALKEAPAFENDFNATWTLRRGDKDLKVQAIKLFSPTLAETLDRFDFTICQFGFDGKSFVLSPWALYDAARKRIVVHKLSYGAASLRRMLKYGSKGYTVCQGAMTEFLLQVSDNPKIINADVKYLD